MKNTWFIGFTSILFAALIAFHGLVKEKLSPVERLQAQLTKTQEAKRAAELRAEIARHELSDYRQQVATLLPEALKGKTVEEAYPLRSLASVLSPGDTIKIERASSIFEKAKIAFRSKDFETSNSLLSDLIRLYPDSVHLVEAHFLLSEGQYQLEDPEAAVTTIEKMVSLFPESELTGFALLRLGRIFEKQDRLEDAADIYRAVITNFPQGEILAQAKTSLKAVAL